ncbi:NepR family anti-sigma factor [Maritalea sp.]|uniref:NepR family anti-sigma factor n=1 Tax=Maritalea sp. TaxID=2003361 RepID=UPI003EF38AB0
MNKNPEEATSTKSATAGKDSGELISLKLRELYDSVCEEGVSDRFLDLLERLDEAEKKSNSQGRSA